MTKDGGWNDSNCDNEFWFVCEMNMHVWAFLTSHLANDNSVIIFLIILNSSEQ
jgi:hypothetical protein